MFVHDRLTCTVFSHSKILCVCIHTTQTCTPLRHTGLTCTVFSHSNDIGLNQSGANSQLTTMSQPVAYEEKIQIYINIYIYIYLYIRERGRESIREPAESHREDRERCRVA